MRPQTLLFAGLACLLSGCGTVVNLASPPPPGPPGMIVPTARSPFGGVVRSGLTGGLLGVGGLGAVTEGIEPKQLVEWAEHTTLGLGALVGVPLSLAGYVVTV